MSDPQSVEVNPVKPEFAWSLRLAGEADKPFIIESWRRHYESAAHTRCPGGGPQYRETQTQVIGQCMERLDIVVASLESRPEQILGWCCAGYGPVIHYVFVKPYYRRMGLAKAMLTALLGQIPPVVFTTHTWERPPQKGDGTRGLMRAAERRGVRVEWNPALIFGGWK